MLVRELHNIHVLCCGAKRVLFTNKLSERWCRISIPYRFTKFPASRHFGKRVTQACMFTLFFVVVRKGHCLPRSYQNVGVTSVFPTGLPSFMHPSILVRVTQTCMPYCNVWAEVVYCGFSGVYQNFNKPIPCVSPKSISPPSFICGCTPVSEIREFNQKKKKKKMNN